MQYTLASVKQAYDALVITRKGLLKIATAYPNEEWIQDLIIYNRGDSGSRVYVFDKIDAALAALEKQNVHDPVS